jgi:hypothetical protein
MKRACTTADRGLQHQRTDVQYEGSTTRNFRSWAFTEGSTPPVPQPRSGDADNFGSELGALEAVEHCIPWGADDCPGGGAVTTETIARRLPVDVIPTSVCRGRPKEAESTCVV